MVCFASFEDNRQTQKFMRPRLFFTEGGKLSYTQIGVDEVAAIDRAASLYNPRIKIAIVSVT